MGSVIENVGSAGTVDPGCESAAGPAVGGAGLGPGSGWVDFRGREHIGTDAAHDRVLQAPGSVAEVSAEAEGHVIYGVDIADSYFKRLRGLMGVSEVAPGYMLFFPDCSSIHCMFMRMAIDAIYLSADFEVLGVETVRPWRLGHAPAGTRHICECAAGQASAWDVLPGDTLRPLCASRQAAGAAWSVI